jgi:hypothetical protein
MRTLGGVLVAVLIVGLVILCALLVLELRSIAHDLRMAADLWHKAAAAARGMR